MSTFVDAIIEPWTHAYFVKAALGGSIVAIACAVLGCYIVLRRMAFIGDAMSHALLPGVGIGYLLMNALLPGGFTAAGLLLGALVAAVITSLSISALGKVDRISEDTSIGIIYTGLFAAGIVILTRFQQHIHIDLNHFFQGDIYGVSWEDMWLGAFASGVVLTIILVFYRYFTIISFDPLMAASLGFRTGLIHTVLTGMIALICVAGISMVGVIMIVGLLITPAALAYLFTDRLPPMMFLAALMGVASVILGLYFSEWVNASGGGAIMFVGFLLFLVGLIVSPRYGVLAKAWRRWKLVPQSDVEDLLKAAVSRGDVRSLPLSAGRLRRAIRRLVTDGLVESLTPEGRLRLTTSGRQEATNIERSHELWEVHLINRGMQATDAHNAAERLEHLRGGHVLDRFENELRSAEAPVYEKPDSDDRLAQEWNVGRWRLSLMRPGEKGRVMADGNQADRDLKQGMAFEVLERDQENGDWLIQTGEGHHMRIKHDEASSTWVERID